MGGHPPGILIQQLNELNVSESLHSWCKHIEMSATPYSICLIGRSFPVAAIGALACRSTPLPVLEALAIFFGTSRLPALASRIQIRLSVFPRLLVLALPAAALIPARLSISEALAILCLAVRLDATTLEGLFFTSPFQKIVDFAILQVTSKLLKNIEFMQLREYFVSPWKLLIKKFSCTSSSLTIQCAVDKFPFSLRFEVGVKYQVLDFIKISNLGANFIILYQYYISAAYWLSSTYFQSPFYLYCHNFQFIQLLGLMLLMIIRNQIYLQFSYKIVKMP